MPLHGHNFIGNETSRRGGDSFRAADPATGAELDGAFFDADVRWLSHYGFRPLDMPTLFGGLSS